MVNPLHNVNRVVYCERVLIPWYKRHDIDNAQMYKHKICCVMIYFFTLQAFFL